MSRTNPPIIASEKNFADWLKSILMPVRKLDVSPGKEITRIPRGPPRPKLELFPYERITRLPRQPVRKVDFMGEPTLQMGEPTLQDYQKRVLQYYQEVARTPHGLSAFPTPTPAGRLDNCTGNVERARLNFRKNFGFNYDDKEHVDRELLEFLKTPPYRLPSTPVLIAKITPLLIAFTLREGFNRAAHRPRRSDQEERNLRSAIQYAWALTGKYLSDGIRRGEARTRAVSEAAAAYQVAESVLRSEMGLSKYSHLRPPECPLPKRRRRRTSRRP
jgi:hypothetical protein